MTVVNSPPAVEVRQLSKRFGAVQALDSIDLRIEPGEVHALIGANGAGKSTLIKILAGATTADEGIVLVGDKAVQINGPGEARAVGLAFIHQELRLVPHFTALENMTLGLVPANRLGGFQWGALRRRVSEVVDQLEIDFDLNRPVANLNVANRWMLVIARCLLENPQMVAMDEPTASLSPREVAILFGVIRGLSARGVAVLYVSHRLEEVEQICTRATVFREGRVVAELEGSDLARAKMFSAIVGTEYRGRAEATSVASVGQGRVRDVVLEVRSIGRGSAVRDASFSVRAGEVLGIAGLVGSGRSELVRLIVGADPRDTGEILVAEQLARINAPTDALAQGISLVPEDRRTQGLFMSKSVSFNLNLTRLPTQTAGRWLPLTSPRRARDLARALIAALSIKTASYERPVRELSGGNQQKVALGRGFDPRVRVLILDEPTQGVDIGARADIHRLIREAANSGRAVIVIASEFVELLGCDRVLVMSRGRLVAELAGVDITEQQMLAAAYASPSAEMVCDSVN